MVEKQQLKIMHKTSSMKKGRYNWEIKACKGSLKQNLCENKDDQLFNATMKLYHKTLQHPCYNKRKMEIHVLIRGKGLTKTLMLLEKQDQRDKPLFLRTTLKSISYFRKTKFQD